MELPHPNYPDICNDDVESDLDDLWLKIKDFDKVHTENEMKGILHTAYLKGYDAGYERGQNSMDPNFPYDKDLFPDLPE